MSKLQGVAISKSEDLEMAWLLILRMRQMGYNFELSWDCQDEEMEAVFIESQSGQEWGGWDETLYNAVLEANGKWQARND